MDAQLKRGILNICILQILKQGTSYGYDIIKTVQKYFPETEESTIYAILRRLNKEELTTIEYSDISNGPQRKYYKLSPKGDEQLKDYISDFAEINEILAEIGISFK